MHYLGLYLCFLLGCFDGIAIWIENPYRQNPNDLYLLSTILFTYMDSL